MLWTFSININVGLHTDHNHDNRPYQRDEANNGRQSDHWQQQQQQQQQPHRHQNHQRTDPPHGQRYQQNRHPYLGSNSSSPQRQGFSNKGQFHADRRDFQQFSFSAHQLTGRQETKGIHRAGAVAATTNGLQKNNQFEKSNASHAPDRGWQRDRQNKGGELFKSSTQHGHGKQHDNFKGSGPRPYQRPHRNGNFHHSNNNNNQSNNNHNNHSNSIGNGGSNNNNNHGGPNNSMRYSGTAHRQNNNSKLFNNGGTTPYPHNPQPQSVMAAPHAQQQFNHPYNEGYSTSSVSSYYQTQAAATPYEASANNPSPANTYPAASNYSQYQSPMPTDATSYTANLAAAYQATAATPISGMVGYPQPIAQAAAAIAAASGAYPPSYGGYPQQLFGATAYQTTTVSNGVYPTYR
ncbi:hypothetical protein BGZ76_010200 [Entomortierella beljakovae]|nr:hypothetical protein BGZ76_010200 [Entomortierella beljakovae]